MPISRKQGAKLYAGLRPSAGARMVDISEGLGIRWGNDDIGGRRG